MRYLAERRNYLPVLAPYDLTRGGSLYNLFGRTDVKELALYVEDQIKAGNWFFNLGIRGDLYNGLAIARQAEPRVGIAYNVTTTNTVLRVSYARTLETPFNENLVLSSQGCCNAVLSPLLALHARVSPETCSRASATSSTPASSRPLANMRSSAASTSGNTRITPSTSACSATLPSPFLSIGTTRRFRASRCMRDVPNFHNISAYVVMSSVAARFFPPQVAGAGATVGTEADYPFRIDHDEKFNQTTHLQYQLPGQVTQPVGRLQLAV